MPSTDTDIQEMDDTFEVSDVKDEADASKGAEQSADASSSAATDASKPDESDTLSVVRNVVEDDAGDDGTEESAASSAESEKDGQETGEENEQEEAEPDNENYSDVPFNKHPRFQEILGKLKTAETDAQRYANVEKFIDDQGLSGEEAADLLQIGGLMKTDPVAAWQRMKPVVQQVLVAAGEVLPEDLKTQVQNGEVSRERAMEISRLRAADKARGAREQFNTQRTETRQQRDEQNAIQTTVSTWEQERQSRDPNFAQKLPALEREVAWLQAREGKPKDAAGVKAQLQKAYDSVSKTFSPAAQTQQRQKKPAVTPVTGGQVNGSVRPQARNTIDVIDQVLASSRAG